jgi:hypothetical protein
MSKINARFKLPFRIRFDVEDGVARIRTKYYLIHASNHPRAAPLMKEVMWPLGDEEGLFDFSGEKHGVLFSSSPREEELRAALLRSYLWKKVEDFRGALARDSRSSLLEMPLAWKKPRMIFVNSMSDLFHENVPLAFIQRVFSTMERASWHTFQILTKRSARLAELAPDLHWPPNVWMGVSIESASYLWRADHLRKGAGCCQVSVFGTAAGPVGRSQPFWHPLGHRRWGERARCAANRGGLDQGYPQAMPKGPLLELEMR